MFSDNEIKLLSSQASDFPLLRLAQRAAKDEHCGKCRGGKVNVHAMLRLAVNKYKSDKKFIEHCKGLFPLPTSISGIRIIP